MDFSFFNKSTAISVAEGTAPIYLKHLCLERGPACPQLHNLAGEEGGRTVKPLTCDFSTARTCALIHWKDDTVRAAAMESQGGH